MQKFKTFFINSFFCYLAIELVEEMLEELLAIGISHVLLKGVSTLFVVSLTQSFKVALKAIVKKLSYKEGNDKMNKLKTLGSWIWYNKKTLLGTVSAALTALSGTGVIDVSALPAMHIGSFNLTPIFYWGVLVVLLLMSTFGKGLEWIQQAKDRIAEKKAEKAEKADIKQAEAEIKAEEKNANQTQAQQEKAEAKRIADEQARIAKEQAEKEHRAKIDAIKADLLKQKQTKNEN